MPLTCSLIGNMVSNNWSVFVLVCWLFMAFVLMQSFTANLSAILTLDQLKFSFSQDYCVGYHNGSFMRNFLTETLNINTCMRGYISVKEFHEAMTKGSKNGGIDAIFDELPYMKLLLNRYKSHYKIVGPSYSTGGFGFVSTIFIHSLPFLFINYCISLHLLLSLMLGSSTQFTINRAFLEGDSQRYSRS